MRTNQSVVGVWWVIAVVAMCCSGSFAGPKNYLKKPDAWFGGEDAKRIAGNILSWQSDLGGWPKNVETAEAPYAGKRGDLKPTFDNSATTDELRYLARMYGATKDKQ